MPIDNDLYDRPGDIWWDETQPLSGLRTAVNGARVAYFSHVLTGQMGMTLRGKTLLDVGCGGGFLAEEFARLGCVVTGVDPSAPSLETARAHAAAAGLPIAYRVGTGEHLPVADASCDLVTCCDVLEHVADLDQVITEIARVLKAGGVFLYDTINRTPLSRLLVITLLQEWAVTRFVPPHLHEWRRFITPAELRATMAAHGLRHREIVGLKPQAHPLALIEALRAHRRGAISYGELGRRAQMGISKDTSSLYMGYAVKAG